MVSPRSKVVQRCGKRPKYAKNSIYHEIRKIPKLLKTVFITKSPCLFLEKFTLKKKNGVKDYGGFEHI